MRAVRDLGVAETQLVEVRDVSVARALRELHEDPKVRYVSRNWIRRPVAVPIPNDPFFGELWGLHNTGQEVGGSSGIPDADIDAPEAWEIEPAWGIAPDGTEAVVAVMDTGADLAHSELAERLWTNAGEIPDNGIDDDGNGYVDDVHGYDFAGEDLEDNTDGDPDPDDPDGHGTHVSGTVLAEGQNEEGVIGVAPRSLLMVLKVCALDGEGEAACPLAAMLEAYAYAVDNGARVLNGSLGGPGFSPEELALLNASTEVLFVFAAGNGGEDGVGDDNDSAPTYPCTMDEEVGYTAENLICVAATNQEDDLAGFSNFGADSVDLGAPGVRTLSTYPEALTPPEFLPYAYLSGTSMATPHVTGAAALLLTALPSTTPAQAKGAILNSTEPLPALAGKTVSGGRLNARLALEDMGLEPPPESEEEGGEEGGEEGESGGGEEEGDEPSSSDDSSEAVAPPSVPPPPIATPDSIAPHTFIKKRPRKVVFTPWRRGRTAFKFRSNEAGVLFFCQFDRKRWRRCGPRFVRWFLAGRHVLRVKARDAAGNVDPTPAVYRFRVRRVSKKQFVRLKRASRRARRDRR